MDGFRPKMLKYESTGRERAIFSENLCEEQNNSLCLPSGHHYEHDIFLPYAIYETLCHELDMRLLGVCCQLS